MRVAFVNTRTDAVGGSQVHVRDLAHALAERGHEVRVFVGGEGPVLDFLAEKRVPFVSLKHLVHCIDPLRDAQALAEMRAALGAFAPDVVSTHTSKAGVIGRAAARTLGIPSIFTAHGWNFTEGIEDCNRGFRVGMERLCGRWSARIITVSEADRDLALRHRVAPPNRIVAIHNGMPDVSRRLRSDPAARTPRIVTVARFEPQKDHRTLFAALSGLTALPWELELIGAGPLLDEMRRLATALGLAGRVSFAGACNDVKERLARAQLFALSSNWEGLPRSIIEAMRAGLPVIASDVGGTRELVATGATGCLVPRGDVEAMRAALARLLTRPQVRAEMGRRGRERYEEQFHFDAMLAKTTAVYRQVLEGQFVRTRRPSHAAATHKSRVVHVVESFGAGTAEVIGRLTRGMPEYEHVVVHGSRREATTVGRDALGPGVSMVEWGNAFREINPAQDLSALVRLMAILRRLGRVGVLHAHGSKGGFHGRLAARLLGRQKSVIYTSHGSPILRRDVGPRVRTLYSALEWLGSRFGGTVVACSGSEQVALRRAGITAFVVPNGTDLERRPVRPRPASPAPFRVGTVARVVRQKDPLLFRRIAERFHVQPDTQFLWIGGGELAAELQGRNVAVTGWLDERGVQDHLGRLDVYLSTSLWEGLSLGALHAMAAGKPLVLRRCPGNVDVVRHGENGFLFDDAEEAEAHIRVLTGDPALRYEMGRRSREIVAEAFDARRMVEAYRSLYRSLIGGRHPVIAPDATEALRHDGAIDTGPRSVPAADVVQPGIGIGPQMPRPGERSRRGRFTPQLLGQTPATVK